VALPPALGDRGAGVPSRRCSTAASEPAEAHLAAWHFDQPDWSGAQGQRPLYADQVQNVPSFDGQALRIVSTTVRRDWCTGSAKPRTDQRRAAAGRDPPAAPAVMEQQAAPPHPGHEWAAPGRWVRLCEVGKIDGGVSVLGSRSPSTRRSHTRLPDLDSRGPPDQSLGAIEWVYLSPQLNKLTHAAWHEVAVNYTRPIAPHGGWENRTGLATKSYFGTWHGTGASRHASARLGHRQQPGRQQPVDGLFDEVETFDRPISPFGRMPLRNSTPQRLRIDAALAVTLRWVSLGNTTNLVRRRLLTRQLARAGDERDSTLLPRRKPFAAVGPGLRVQGRRSPRLGRSKPAPVENRGRVISWSIRRWPPVVHAIETLHADLVATAGPSSATMCHVTRRRLNQRAVNPTYVENLARVKAVIQSDYQAAPAEAKAVFIVGTSSSLFRRDLEDGHPDHQGAWPADAYYGDVDGPWSDTVCNTSTNSPSVFRNLPRWQTRRQ